MNYQSKAQRPIIVLNLVSRMAMLRSSLKLLGRAKHTNSIRHSSGIRETKDNLEQLRIQKIRKQQAHEDQLYQQHLDFRRQVRTICQILSTNPQNSKVSNLLNPINLKPTEPLVVEVLKNLSNSGFLALSFFYWAETQPHFGHTSETYHALIESLGRIKQFNKIWDLVEEMKIKGILCRETFAVICRRYARVRMADEAINTIERMEREFGLRIEVTDFNRMLDYLCKSKHVERAQEVFDKMLKRGLEPDIKSYTILLDGWARRSNLSKVIEMCSEMKAGGFKLDTVSAGIVINAYCKVQKFDDAVKTFLAMERRGMQMTSHMYCTLISGLGLGNRLREALGIYTRWKASGARPDAPTYNAVVGAYCHAEKYTEAMVVVEQMRRSCVGPNSRTYDIIMHNLIKQGKINEAFEAFIMMGQEPDMEGPTVSSYEMIVRMFCREGNMEMAGKVWSEMRSKGLIPGMNGFSTMIERLCREGMVEEACVYFEEMLGFGIRPPGRMFGNVKSALLLKGREDLLRGLRDKIDKLRKCSLPEDELSWDDQEPALVIDE